VNRCYKVNSIVHNLIYQEDVQGEFIDWFLSGNRLSAETLPCFFLKPFALLLNLRIQLQTEESAHGKERQ
jgi:hypothetical protein